MPTHHFDGLLFYFELRFLAYNLVLWYQHYVLAQDHCLQAMRVFELVTSLASTTVVAEQTPHTGLVFFLANAPKLMQSLLALTQAWLQRTRSLELVLLRNFSRLRYDWSQLVYDIWRASPRPDPLLPPISCKT